MEALVNSILFDYDKMLNIILTDKYKIIGKCDIDEIFKRYEETLSHIISSNISFDNHNSSTGVLCDKEKYIS